MKRVRELLTELGGCDHSVGICYCDITREVEAHEKLLGAFRQAQMKIDGDNRALPMHILRENMARAIAGVES